MIRDLMKLIIKIILFIFLICFVTMGIDLYRIKNNNLPVFCSYEYNSKNNIQTFRGIIYTASRKVYASPNESLSDSSNIKFKIIMFNVKIK
ncbi:MAG: hypothetical protein IJ097_04220 [Bacilli bacterium]|nr:hypothetical protein [Bacilli bacterium]